MKNKNFVLHPDRMKITADKIDKGLPLNWNDLQAWVKYNYMIFNDEEW